MNREALRIMASDALEGLTILGLGCAYLLTTMATFAVAMDLLARYIGVSGLDLPEIAYVLAAVWLLVTLPVMLWTWYDSAKDRAGTDS